MTARAGTMAIGLVWLLVISGCATKPDGRTDTGTLDVSDDVVDDGDLVDVPFDDTDVSLDTVDATDTTTIDDEALDDSPDVVTPLGVPFGPFALFDGWTDWDYGPAPFTLTLNFVGAEAIISTLDAAAAAGVHIVMAMTGGNHDNYITDGEFDRSLWNARQDTFDTPEIRAAVAARVADGTIIAATLMDEPDHVSWGGVMTPAEIDSMSEYVKAIFPTLPTTTVVQLNWYPTYEYTSLDTIVRQFSYDLFPAQGPNEPNEYREATITQAVAQNIGVIFSMNILDGGSRIDGCPVPETGGVGTYGPNCRMTPAQVEAAADALTLDGACGMLMWQSDPDWYGDPDHVDAFTSAAAILADRTFSRCTP